MDCSKSLRSEVVAGSGSESRTADSGGNAGWPWRVLFSMVSSGIGRFAPDVAFVRPDESLPTAHYDPADYWLQDDLIYCSICADAGSHGVEHYLVHDCLDDWLVSK